MSIHLLSVADALHELRSSMDGLSNLEAARRRAEYGPNKIVCVRRRSWWPRLRRHFIHFFALILWLAAGLAFFAEHAEPGQGMLMLGYAIVGVIVVNGLFSFAQEYRAEHALATLTKLLPHEVQVRRGGRVSTIAVSMLVPGDIIFLSSGSDVPADCRLVEAFGVRVNTATITGESWPQARHADAASEADTLQSRNILLAGTTLVTGEATAVVFATGVATEFGRIAHLTQTTSKVASPLQIEIARLSRWVALLATGLGIVFFLVGQSLGLSFWANCIFAIGIIVANVPEGLLPTVTLALAMGAQRMARRNALIRHLPSVETLGSTTVICTDKTGTLTRNQLQVSKLYVDGRVCDASDESVHTSETVRTLRQIAARCHALKTTAPVSTITRAFGDPLEIALVAYAQGFSSGDASSSEKVDEIPFDADRRRMSTLFRAAQGAVLYTKGALESVLPLCRSVMLGGRAVSLTAQHEQGFRAAEESLAREGFRVIALAYRNVVDAIDPSALEQELILVGLAALEDPPRDEVPRAVQQCHGAGIRIIMTTGDHPQTARAIAQRIGLVSNAEPRIVTGEQLTRLTDVELQLELDHTDLIFARIAADQKRRIVAALKRKGEIVAVTGDGVNDTPALKEAHIGIAMGIAGTDVAKEAADIVLLDDNFASIVAAVEEGRSVFDNIRKFLTYILTSNIPEIVPYLAFVLLKIPLPLTIIQMLAVDLGTDMLPALALGAERPDPDIMRRPPRRRDMPLVDLRLIARAYLWLGPLQAIAAMATFFFVLNASGWHYGEMPASHDPLYLQATTACLVAIVVAQVVNVWLCRSERRSVVAMGFFSNPLILVGIVVELGVILLIVYTPWGNQVFGTASLPLNVWLFTLPFALGILVLEELRKVILRHRRVTPR